ncbi:MAG: IS3 family transposase [Chloroflexi bacterium]|nr:IS3 family transposase [Chloroflexota bacterium]
MVKRRTYSAAFKARVVMEMISGAKSQAEIAREHRIKPDLLARWKRQFLENASSLFEKERPNHEVEVRIAELEQALGRKTLELEVAKKASNNLQPAQRRHIAHELVETYPVTLVCQVLAVPRSSYYYQPAERDEEALKQAIRDLAAQWPTYGYRRITAELQRAAWLVNHKLVRRLMDELELLVQPQPKKRGTTDSRHGWPRFPNLVLELAVTYPDQVWVGDITYIALRRDFVYLAILMDVFTRAIRGWHLARSLDQTLTITALDRALACGRPAIHHSDQGVQYAAGDYVQRLENVGSAISMADIGAAWQNGYAERLIRTIKEEEVYLAEYNDYHDAYQQIGRFLDDVYMHKRIHSSLGYLTPVEFEAQWRAGQQPPALIPLK